MKKRSVRSSIVIRKNRLKRRSGKILREVVLTVSIVIATGLVGLGMVYSYNVILCSDYFTLKDTTVRGTDRLSEGEVLQLSGITGTTNILTVDMNRMVTGIKTNPWVRDVRMGRELPNRLVIEIEERRPVALISHEQHIYLLDEEGTIFKNLDNGDRVDLPVMTGFSESGVLDEQLLRGAMDLLDYLSRQAGYPSMENISEIRGDHLYGYSLYTVDHRFFVLGFGDYDKKFSRLRTILFDLTAKHLSLSPLLVDLTDPGRVIVRHGGAAGRERGDGRKRTDI
ncbi:MAG: FtsQ-type POTRA domain-containing protein [Syntrophales bacterium]|jgi:cell division protein FtsQ|nr:FtsQ-type POTRA domain-containing protein [Syntrophales bacterium]MCK9528621.1 FtsQ-type POTRA domain-containing protein [Syntrophales bacterium]MDX9923062.1 FtsQ-type POTRA domain-containing protein [Syntrophales bacterium]